MVNEKTILAVAKLARLKIEAHEAAHYGEQLSKVLTHFDQIAHIDTANVEPLVSPVEAEYFSEDSFREDLALDLFTAEEMLENAPDKMGHLFKVPPVVG